MNPQISNEVQELKLHLQRYPEQSAQLAVNHLEDYLVLLNEYNHLQQQIDRLRYAKRYPLGLSKSFLISSDSFLDAQLSLEQLFRVEAFKRSLVQDPCKSQFWAVEYFKFFLHLSESYHHQKAQLLSLYISKRKPQLPYFL
jgi:hypothetical protein